MNRAPSPKARRATHGAASALGCTLAAAFGLLGCVHAPSAADRVNDDLSVMRSEHSVDKLLARGRAFRSVGDLTRAEQYLSAALDAGGNPGLVLPELLRVCVAADRYRVAIAYAAPLLERHPHDRRLRFVLAALRANVGDALGARSDLEQMLADAPEDANAHFAYGALLRDQFGDRQGADQEFRSYLRLDPDGAHRDEARSGLLEAVR